MLLMRRVNQCIVVDSACHSFWPSSTRHCTPHPTPSRPSNPYHVEDKVPNEAGPGFPPSWITNGAPAPDALEQTASLLMDSYTPLGGTDPGSYRAARPLLTVKTTDPHLQAEPSPSASHAVLLTRSYSCPRYWPTTNTAPVPRHTIGHSSPATRGMLCAAMAAYYAHAIPSQTKPLWPTPVARRARQDVTRQDDRCLLGQMRTARRQPSLPAIHLLYLPPFFSTCHKYPPPAVAPPTFHSTRLRASTLDPPARRPSPNQETPSGF